MWRIPFPSFQWRVEKYLKYDITSISLDDINQRSILIRIYLNHLPKKTSQIFSTTSPEWGQDGFSILHVLHKKAKFHSFETPPQSTIHGMPSSHFLGGNWGVDVEKAKRKKFIYTPQRCSNIVTKVMVRGSCICMFSRGDNSNLNCWWLDLN